MTHLRLLQLALSGACGNYNNANNSVERAAAQQEIDQIRALIEAEHRRLNRIGMEKAR